MVVLYEVQQLHLEAQDCLRWNRARPAGSVGHVWVADQLALLAQVHRRNALVPGLDHSALADVELEWFTSVDRRVKNLTVKEGSVVVHDNSRVRLRALVARVSLLDHPLEQLVRNKLHVLRVLAQLLELLLVLLADICAHCVLFTHYLGSGN